METDPAGYVDGANRYQMETGNPVGRLDPAGTDSTTQPAATQPIDGIVSVPGNTWNLLNQGGVPTSQFMQNYVSSHQWGHSGPATPDAPPPGQDVVIDSRHDTLQIGDTSGLTKEQIDNLQGLINQFNDISAKHEAQMAADLHKIFNDACSWKDRNANGRKYSDPATSEFERKDLLEQMLALQRILNAPGVKAPKRALNSVQGTIDYLTRIAPNNPATQPATEPASGNGYNK